MKQLERRWKVLLVTAVAVFMAMGGARDHGLMAIKPGGEGDVTATHVLWQERPTYRSFQFLAPSSLSCSWE